MPTDDLQPNYREGDSWGATAVNALIRRNSAPIVGRGDAGIDVRVADNQIQVSGIPSDRVKWGIVTTAITARSGDTLGKGSVEIYTVTPGTQTAVDSGEKIDVLSISSTTAGVPVNTWVMVIWDDDGQAMLGPVDCGN